MLQQLYVKEPCMFVAAVQTQMQLIADLISRVKDSTVLLECIRVGEQLMQQGLVPLANYTIHGHINQQQLDLGHTIVGEMLKQPRPSHLPESDHGIVPVEATANMIGAVFMSVLQPCSLGDGVHLDVRLAAAGFVNRWLPELYIDDAELIQRAWNATLRWMTCSTDKAERLLGLTTLATLISCGLASIWVKATDGINCAAKALPILLEYTASNDTVLCEKAFDTFTEVYRRWNGQKCYLLKQPQDASFPAIAAAAMPNIVRIASNGEQQAAFAYEMIREFEGHGVVSVDQLCISGGAIASALAALRSLLGGETPANTAQLAAIDILAHVKDRAAFLLCIQSDHPSTVSNLVSLLQTDMLPSVAATKLRAITAAILSSLQKAMRAPADTYIHPFHYMLELIWILKDCFRRCAEFFAIYTQSHKLDVS